MVAAPHLLDTGQVVIAIRAICPARAKINRDRAAGSTIKRPILRIGTADQRIIAKAA